MRSSFAKPRTVKRKAAGQYTLGRWVEGAETTVTINASVQPLKMNEMEALPEGKRTGSAVKVYSDTRLYTAQEETATQGATNPDILVHDGADWEIVACAPYQSGVVNHYKAYAVMVKVVSS